MIQPFKGGQMAHHGHKLGDHGEDYWYRGEIKEITLQNNKLRVTFAWRAKDQNFPSSPERWVKDDTLEVSEDLSIYVIPENDGDDNWIWAGIAHYLIDEGFSLYPPDHKSTLNPAEVEGLQLVAS